jgi:hypothetical protein
MSGRIARMVVPFDATLGEPSRHRHCSPPWLPTQGGGHGGPAGRGRRQPLTVIYPSRTHYLPRGSENGGGASRLTRRMRVHA